MRYAGDEESLRAELERVLPEEAAFGVNPRGAPEDQTTAVRSQIFIKQTFGEFAYRPGRLGGSFTIDPAWVSENIVTETLPVIGTVRCHRALIPVLRDVMNELEARDAGNVIQRSGLPGVLQPALRGELDAHVTPRLGRCRRHQLLQSARWRTRIPRSIRSCWR